MRKLENQEIKLIEKRILLEVDRFAEDTNIEYFLAYGTLLGAVRHSGFIPWDDDIDIFMPRNSYDAFLNSFNQYSSRYKVIDASNTANYPYAFAKVIDTETEITEFRFQEYKSGVYIDVFPLDYVGNDKREIERLNRKLNIKRSILKYKTLRPSYYRGLRRVLLCLIKTALAFINTKQVIIRIDKEIRKNQNESTYFASMPMLTYGNKEIYEASWFRDYIMVMFEGSSLRAPIEYKKVLESTYGDYMTLPPPDKRKTHHSFDAWIRKDEDIEL